MQRLLIALVMLLGASTTHALTGTWTQLFPTPTTRYVPQSFQGCPGDLETTASPVGRAQSGTASDGIETIFYMGGGHQGYGSNDVELYSISQNKWTQMYVPECVPACCCNPSCGSPTDPACANDPIDCSGGPPGCYPGPCGIFNGVGSYTLTGTGKPYTEHMQQYYSFNPVTNHFVGVPTCGTMEFDPVGNQWVRLTHNRPSSSAFPARGATYDPGVGVLGYATAPFSGDPSVLRYDYGANAWFVHSPLPSDFSTNGNGGDQFDAYDSVHGQHLFSWFGPSGGTMWLYTATGGTEPNAGTFTKITNEPQAVHCNNSGETGIYCPASFAYYPAASQWIILRAQTNGTTTVWAYDPVGNAWSQVTTNQGPINPGASIVGYPASMHYISSRGKIYFLQTYDGGAAGKGGFPKTTGFGSGTDATMMWTFELTGITPSATPTGPTPTHSPTLTPIPPQTFTPTRSPTPTPSLTPTACTGMTWHVGSTRGVFADSDTSITSVAGRVHNCDRVEIDSEYYRRNNTVGGAIAIWTANRLTLIGVNPTESFPRPQLDSGGIGAGPDKAIWVIQGNDTIVDNIEFECETAKVDTTVCGTWTGDSPGSGIRVEAANLTVRNSYFHDNDDGILDGTTMAGLDDFENNIFFRNGDDYGNYNTPGSTHNVYVSNQAKTVIFKGNKSYGALVGHEFKSRAAATYVIANWIGDGATGSSSREIDIPDGGLTYIIGNAIQKRTTVNNGEMVGYAAESQTQPIQELYFINNTMVNDAAAAATFVNGRHGAVWFENNILWGAGSSGISWAGAPDVQAGNLFGSADPLFVNRAGYDYHLTNGSPAINLGVAPGTSIEGYSLTPTLEYAVPSGTTARYVSGALDAGAFEFALPNPPVLR